jgi:hypothetical protein
MRIALLCILIGLSGCTGAILDPGAQSPDGGGHHFDGGAPLPDGGSPISDGGSPNDGGGDPPPGSLAERYPGDHGIGADPAVVWYENFEHPSVDALVARYESAKPAGLALIADAPAPSPGARSVRMSAGGGVGEASDLYKRLPGDGHDQLYLRYYVKHEAGAPYHHSGAWMGGYNPPLNWPNPQAGTRPTGNDRLGVAIEPGGATATGGRRLDFYNYWMNMRSWMAGEPTGSNAFYGNPLVHREDVRVLDGVWQCIEYMVRLNPDPSSAAGGELALWIEDRLIYHYTQEGPRGYWIRDKFCPRDADARTCLDFAPPPDQRTQDVVNLQWRSSTALRLNWLWLMNYISSGSGGIQYDDLVIATTRVGCIR